MSRGKLILVIGPTGSGKGTLMRHALGRFPDLTSPPSYTTRARRADAVENAHYKFVSVEEFKAKIETGDFLEWAEFSGNYYGTPRREVEEGLAAGKVMFKEMEVQGVRQVRALLPKTELILVFVEAGSWEESKQRAIAREPLSDEALEMRHKRYEDEMVFMPEADFIIHNLAGKYREAEDAFEAIIAKAIEDSRGA